MLALGLAACVNEIGPEGKAGPAGEVGPAGPEGPQGEPGDGSDPADYIQNQTAAAQPASFSISGSGAVTGGFYFTGGNGDANGDGGISVADRALVSAHLVGTRTLTVAEFQRADVDGDGLVTILDSDRISDLIGGADLATVQREGRRLVDRAGTGLFLGSGDVNRDGTVSIADVSLLTTYLNGTSTLTPTQRLHADINGDRRTDLTDVLLITQIALGSPKSFDDARRPADVAYSADLNGYFILGKKVAGTPSTGDCTANNVGAMAFDTTNTRLYVCVANSTWRFVALQ